MAACDNLFQMFEFCNTLHLSRQNDDRCKLLNWKADSFLHSYNQTVNESVEYDLDENMCDRLTKQCCSPLYERLVQQLTTLDDLKVED